MSELITLQANGVNARVANRPVTRQEYVAYLHALGAPVPATMTRPGQSHAPVVGVSQVDAIAYCGWLGAQQGQAYRLPAVAELLELAGSSGNQGTSEDVWPHTHSDRPDVPGFRGSIMYLCEWTRETETIPQANGEARVLGSVFYPPWLREGNNPKQVQGMMLSTQGYSFVSFRLAADLGNPR